ncbi:HAAS signaling domain-containing protein [Pedococcus soli]
MSSSTTHPLTEAWLRDLELLLHGIDPGERAEVLAGVREHLDGSLPPDASDDDVRRVLTDLGSPQSVADEAWAGRAIPRPGASVRSTWLGIAASCINGLGIALVTLWSWSVTAPFEIIALGTLLVIPWGIAVVLSMLAPGWTTRQRVTSALLFPATTVGYAAVGEVAVRIFGPSLLNIIPMVVVLGVVLWVLVGLVRAVTRVAR